MNAIEVHNLSKRFVHYPSQRARFLDMVSAGRVGRGSEFWALKDVSFEVPKGTTFGIIGQNGSGKSTLLSILAGVLQSTSGTFAVNGKVAAILELGSGFHHEFTGRENIYMYATILGLSRAEIDRRFDEIVDFSELHEAIDRPLYTYSSGMIARIAFACAINVDADILIIDEALAVGDALFQQRCFRKIKQMQMEGKTILYVGHDLETVRNMCSSAMLLDGGEIVRQGGANHVLNFYTALIQEREQVYRESSSSNKKKLDHNEFTILERDNLEKRGVRFGTKDVEIQSIEMANKDHASKDYFRSGEEDVHIRIMLKSNKDIDEGLNVGFLLRNKYGDVYGINTYWLQVNIEKKKCGDEFVVEFTQCLNLGAGIYTVSPIVAYKYSANDEAVLDWLNDWFTFTVYADNFFLGYANLQSRAVVYNQLVPGKFQSNMVMKNTPNTLNKESAPDMNTLPEIFRRILSLYDGLGIGSTIIEQWAIKMPDFFVLAQEINERKPRRILEIGTFVGVSTFLISSIVDDEQEIYSIDPNLPLINEVEAVSGKQEFISTSMRTLDVAREVKNSHLANRNINFLEGCLNYDSSYSGASGFHKFFPDLLREGIKFDLIFIDGLHFADAVLSDLEASAEILSDNGVILLHDGRGLWAEEVLFGTCKFIQKRNNYSLSRFSDSSIVKLRNT